MEGFFTKVWHGVGCGMAKGGHGGPPVPSLRQPPGHSGAERGRA